MDFTKSRKGLGIDVKLKRYGSDYKLTKKDLDDIETAYEFQTSELT